jgi:hypothetical protein
VKKIIVGAITVLVIVVSFVLLLRGNEDTWICQNGNWVKHGHPSALMPAKPCVQTNNPAPTVNPNANIQFSSPKNGDTVGSQFVIKGQARVFENQLNFRVKDAKGRALIEGTMTAQAQNAGQFGEFTATISSMPKGKTTIEVFDKSAKDGLEIDKVSIEVMVK